MIFVIKESNLTYDEYKDLVKKADFVVDENGEYPKKVDKPFLKVLADKLFTYLKRLRELDDA